MEQKPENEIITAAERLNPSTLSAFIVPEVKSTHDESQAIKGIYEKKKFEEEAEAKLAELTKGAREYIETVRRIFAPFLAEAERVEQTNKAALLVYHEMTKGEKTIKTEWGSLTYTERAGVIIDDEEAIPKNYCSPDKAKIAAALKAGLKVKGARLEIQKTPSFRSAK